VEKGKDAGGLQGEILSIVLLSYLEVASHTPASGTSSKVC